jgi:hypothetical protein
MENPMRNAGLLALAAVLAVLLASFTPAVWIDAAPDEPTLASVSPSELTLAAKNLPTGDRHDAH